ncbi:MAG: redox-sensing transcriptional repressor Rex, partial [Phototrophicales bacterium]
DREWSVVLVGAGDLGSALANYQGFVDRGFRIACVFDNAPDKVGRSLGEFTIQPMTQLASVVKEQQIRIAMIAVPAGQAQSVADALVDAGILAILN